jgi:integrase/recombinase XerD
LNVSKIELKDITKECVVEFLDWLQSNRKCSNATRNVRLAGIHSFFRFLQYQHPENLYEWQRILSIRAKKTNTQAINYLTIDGIKLLLEQPDTSTHKGRRDLAMLALMYDCAARVQEISDLKPFSIRLNKPYTIKIVGKGNKARIVPLMKEEILHIKRYMTENHLLEAHSGLNPLFYNSRKEKLTRAGINSILKKYTNMARIKNTSLIPERISCHTLRHSKAMHLLQAGVNLVYIVDFN